MSKICIVIPCFNEAFRIQAKEFLKFLEENPPYEILFVNDGSTDNTIEKLTFIKNNHPSRVDIITLSPNQGKASAVRDGVLWAHHKNQYEIIGFIDADLSVPFNEIHNIVGYLNGNVVMVFGSRIKIYGSNINRVFYRHILGRVFATIASLYLKKSIYDSQCGIKFFKSHIIESLFHEKFKTNWIFDLELFERYFKKNDANSILEIPLKSWNDISGSKINILTAPAILYEIMILIMTRIGEKKIL